MLCLLGKIVKQRQLSAEVPESSGSPLTGPKTKKYNTCLPQDRKMRKSVRRWDFYDYSQDSPPQDSPLGGNPDGGES